MSKVTRIISIHLLIAYIAFICYLCFATADSFPSIDLNFFGLPMDKVAHFLMFFPVPYLLFFSFFNYRKKFWCIIRNVLLIFVFGCVMAAATEFIQGMLPYRSPELADFRADAISIAIGSVTLVLLNILNLKRAK